MQAGEEDRAWYDQVRGDRSVEAVFAFLSQAMCTSAREEIELPHIVLCRDVETGCTSYSGPFPNGLAALVAAERERVVDDATNDGSPMSFSVAALHPGGSDEPMGFC